MKRRFTRIIAVFLTFVLMISLGATAKEKTQGEELYDDLLEMVDFLKANHIQATEDDDPIKMGLIKMFDLYPSMYQSFVNFMFQSYDPYSYYLDVATHDAAFDSTTYVGGIGVTLEQKEDGVYIESLVEESAAVKVGLKPGDKLLEADGVPLDGFTVEMIGEIVRGDVGSEIKIRVLRDGQELSFTLTRIAMLSSPVSASLLGNGVAYMSITSFDDINTYLDFSILYKGLPEQGVSTVILDLRDNPGGDVNVALNIIERLIPDEGIPYFMLERTNPRRVDTYVSTGLGWDATKMVILINENTASCAELVAGVLHELGYATLIGTKTYGKGLGQMHTQITENEYAVVTNSELFLPVSGSFEGIGIQPDIEVAMGSKYYHLPELAPITPDRAVYAGTSTNALAIEQRLHELGYFSGTPDNVADRATFLAVNRFQKANGYDISNDYCDANTVRKLDRAVRDMDGKAVPVDTQYERAVTVAEGYAAENVAPTRVDMNKITFGEENKD